MARPPRACDACGVCDACEACDAIERFGDGCRRYIVTFTDTYSRFSLAWGTTRHGSLAAKEFFDIVCEPFPYRLEYVLTDNGSEFMKRFDAELRWLHRTHWHTCPKTPKMNVHAERFDRTIQEEFVAYEEHLLRTPAEFNPKRFPG